LLRLHETPSAATASNNIAPKSLLPASEVPFTFAQSLRLNLPPPIRRPCPIIGFSIPESSRLAFLLAAPSAIRQSMCLKSFAPDALKPESRRGESSYLLEPVRAIRPTCFATLPAPSTNSPAHTDHGRLPRERNRCWTLFSGPRSMRARQETVRASA